MIRCRQYPVEGVLAPATKLEYNLAKDERVNGEVTFWRRPGYAATYGPGQWPWWLKLRRIVYNQLQPTNDGWIKLWQASWSQYSDQQRLIYFSTVRHKVDIRPPREDTAVKTSPLLYWRPKGARLFNPYNFRGTGVSCRDCLANPRSRMTG